MMAQRRWSLGPRGRASGTPPPGAAPSPWGASASPPRGGKRPAEFEGAGALLHGGLEGAVDDHDFAGGLHLRGGAAVAVGELVEGPAGNLDDAVVEGGLEGGLGAAGDGVVNLVQALADGDFWRRRGRLGVAGGLAGESGGAAANAGVDLDDVVGAVFLPPVADDLGDAGGAAGGRTGRCSRLRCPVRE